jgi:hypothetical protein
MGHLHRHHPELCETEEIDLAAIAEEYRAATAQLDAPAGELWTDEEVAARAKAAGRELPF